MRPSFPGIAFTVVLGLLSDGLEAAGLDCRGARTDIERRICKDVSLRQLDALLTFTYEEEHSRLVALEEQDRADALEREQQNWLKVIRDGCPDSACMRKAYRQRVASIDGVTAAGVPDAPEKGDFNFDGHEDFALFNGKNGPYGSYTYNVYLYSPEKRIFELSESFSSLTLKSLNFFQIDARRKRLTTFTKSGCCYHEFTEYIVRKNRPVEVFRAINEFDGKTTMVTEMKRVGGQWQKIRRYRCLPSNAAIPARHELLS